MVLISPPNRERQVTTTEDPPWDRPRTPLEVPCYDKQKVARQVNFVSGVARMLLAFFAVLIEAVAIKRGSHLKVFMFESVWNGVPLLMCGALGIAAATRKESTKIKTTHLISSLCIGCPFAAIQWGLAGSAWSADEALDRSSVPFSAAVSLIGFLHVILNSACVSLNCASVCCPDPDLSLLAVSTYGSSSRTNTTVNETSELPDHIRLLFDPQSIRGRFNGGNHRDGQENGGIRTGLSTPPPTPEERSSISPPYSPGRHSRRAQNFSDPPPSYEEVMRNHSPPETPPPHFSDVT